MLLTINYLTFIWSRQVASGLRLRVLDLLTSLQVLLITLTCLQLFVLRRLEGDEGGWGRVGDRWLM